MKNVSILTPVTSDRKKFLQLMCMNIVGQNYPREKLTWIMLDTWKSDGTQTKPMLDDREIKEIQKGIHPAKFIYKYIPQKMGIGEKRNKLVKLSSDKVFVNMDSDDIYLSNYVGTLMDNLKGKVGIAGSPEMMFVFPLQNYQYSYIRCPAYRQIHEGAMGFTWRHHKKMGGFSSDGTGEGAKMFDGCGEQAFKKVDITKLMCCIAHETNTCAKDRFLKNKVDCDVRGPQMKFLETLYPPEDAVIVDNSDDSISD
jgi:hypothetical protein